MVGNVAEWVADWTDLANGACTDWTTARGLPGGDYSCFGGDGSIPFRQVPGALLRGGNSSNGLSAGVFTVGSGLDPTTSTLNGIGFRCAR